MPTKNNSIFKKRFDIFSHKRSFVYSKDKLTSALIIFALAIFLFVVIFHFYFPDNLKVKIGEVSPVNIVSPRTFTYIDTAKTEQLKKEIASSVPPVYRLDVSREKIVLQNIDNVFQEISSILNSNADNVKKHDELKLLFPDNEKFADFLIKEDFSQIDKMHQFIKSVAYKLMVMGVKSDSINQSVQIGVDEINKSSFNDDEKQFLIYVLRHNMQPNLIYDKEATENAVQKAVSSIPPVKVTVNKGEIIVKKGEQITQNEYNMLVAAGLVRAKNDWLVIVSIIFFILFFIGVSYLALSASGKITNKNVVKKTVEFTTIIVLTYIVLVFVQPISPFLLPIPFLAFLLFSFFDMFSTVIISIAFLLLTVIPFDIKSSILLAIVVSAVLSLFVLRRFKRIFTIIYAGIVGGVGLALLGIFLDIVSKVPFTRMELDVAYSFLNFFGSSVIALGVIFVLSYIFNEATVIRLLELSDTNNYLLRQLLLKAPGTYQHSMNVASIASTAASYIGADALLVRVGAYYHDIGKMLHPYYFTENQINIPNLLKQISPNLSKSVIINHVKDGVQIAKKHRLPEEVIDFIRTHHGTSIVSYFYHMAKESDPNVRPEDFRYPGPLPRTKEQAILMLSDAIEAAMHSEEIASAGKIEEIVDKIIKGRVEDGQLSESDLTLRDLKALKESFVKSMVTFYHKREAYPSTQNG
jgi:putative nucleotidyltransferase with HDIG domain